MGRLAERQQFKNESGGWQGVVIIGPRNEPRGIAVAPDDTVWLTEDEQELTANAPRRPENNPFIPQTVVRRNAETDAEENVEITPLVPVNEGRFIPAQERPTPGLVGKEPAEAPTEAPKVPTVPPRAAKAAEAAEETGAAVPPPSSPPEGEFARDEEVGTPDAPAPQPGPPPAPVPYSPGSSPPPKPPPE